MEILDKLLQEIFFRYLGISPKDRRIVICESAFTPAPFRQALVRVLFKRFSVPSVAFILDLVLPLYLTGLSTGFVVDLGFEATRVMPVFVGIPLLSAMSSAAGGRSMNARLRSIIRAHLPDEPPWLGDDAIDDIKAGACFVALDSEDVPENHRLKTDRSTRLTLKAHGSVEVPAAARWEPAEMLFSVPADEDRDTVPGPEYGAWSCDNIPEAFIRTLEKCPMDTRAAVLQNIVVVGGGAMLPGLLPRLALALRDALLKHPTMSALAERLTFTPLSFAPICTVWTGGAVYGSLEGVHDYTMDHFERNVPLPDWAREGFA